MDGLPILKHVIAMAKMRAVMGDSTSLAGDRERAYSDNIQACRRNDKNQSWDGDSTSSTRGRSKRQVTTLPR